jgi:hypothetical protein
LRSGWRSTALRARSERSRQSAPVIPAGPGLACSAGARRSRASRFGRDGPVVTEPAPLAGIISVLAMLLIGAAIVGNLLG